MSDSKPFPEQLIVVGGRQRAKALDLDEWQAYETAVIAEVDCQTLKGKVVVEYRSPPENCADQKPSIVFKAGDLNSQKQRLLVCTQTEILEYDVATWKPTYYFSHPWFNDLHHACYRDETTIMLANTGLDQVLEIRRDLEDPTQSSISHQWNVGTTPTWERFDRSTDYRKLATTKPHQSHPNFVFQFADRWYTTRFHQQDVVDLDSSATSLSIDCGNPHDGIVNGDLVYFTTTNGHVCGYDLLSNRKWVELDFNPDEGGEKLLGWCRGLLIQPAIESGGLTAWVGFSRIRPTWMRKNLSWIKQGFQSKGQYGTSPTRVTCYQLPADAANPGQTSRDPIVDSSCSILSEINLEDLGMNAVFGIYAK